MSDTENKPKPHLTVSCSRLVPPDDEFPRGCRVRCEEDDPRADECVVKTGGREFRFGRSPIDPTRWDPAMDTLKWALQHVFDEGRAAQRQIMRDALGLPTAWGGEMHGRSGT